jgi:hypothetical protein
MKQVLQFTCVAAIVTASIFTLSSFNTAPKENPKPLPMAYSINLQNKSDVGTNQQWTWMLTNPNPGNGNNGTLQNVSHWDVALSPAAEAALVSAEYSYDGITWYSLSIEVERDPSIRMCTTTDVLKFAVGTNGSAPVYYRATFDQQFSQNAYATSYIKTGGGLQGCNLYYFSGMGQRLD